MGSTGTGSFTDYPGSQGGRSSGGNDGGGGGNQCDIAIGNMVLEDVANCAYYASHSDVPAVGTGVVLRQQLVGGRLAVALASGEVLGLVPTKYNYLVACMSQDYSYAGQVVSSSASLLPYVSVDIGSV